MCRSLKTLVIASAPKSKKYEPEAVRHVVLFFDKAMKDDNFNYSKYLQDIVKR